MIRPPRSMAAHALTLAAAVAGAVTPAPSPHGLDLAGIDRSVAPGDDFFRYANGAWLKTTEIPPDRSNVGVFSVLFDQAQQRTRQLLDAAASGTAATGSDERKIGDYYATILDEQGIEAKGVAPLKGLLSPIE